MPQRKMETQTNGRMKRSSEMPAALMATNSKLSPRFPNVIIDEINIAIGIASINNDALAYHKNWQIVAKSSPFPTRSSMYFHKLCIISTKNAIKKVTTKGPIKDFKMSLSNFLIILSISATEVVKNAYFS